MKTNILVLSLIFLTAIEVQSCNNEDRTEQQRDYEKYKQKFEPTLVAHFPKEIHSPYITMSSSQDNSNNDVGFVLFEFEVNKKALNSIMNNVESENIIGEYKSSDVNLLYVIPNKMDDGSLNPRRLDTSIDYNNHYR